jgi:hypothetical protein
MKYDKYLKTEELEWNWSFDPKTKLHTLVLTHVPSKKSVNGTVFDSKIHTNLQDRKLVLQESLTEKLEKLIFGV